MQTFQNRYGIAKTEKPKSGFREKKISIHRWCESLLQIFPSQESSANDVFILKQPIQSDLGEILRKEFLKNTKKKPNMPIPAWHVVGKELCLPRSYHLRGRFQ